MVGAARNFSSRFVHSTPSNDLLQSNPFQQRKRASNLPIERGKLDEAPFLQNITIVQAEVSLRLLKGCAPCWSPSADLATAVFQRSPFSSVHLRG
jgi:hypothetical protein